MLEMGIVSRLMIRLTTPPTTKKTAAKSTNPCFTGETPFIFNTKELHTASITLSVIPLCRSEQCVDLKERV